MFKDNLKQARKNSKLTQKQIAEMLNISDNSVSNWEKGVSRPDIEQVAQLCRILKISADTLLDNNLEVNLTPDEFVRIKKYRSLDPYSKKAVDSLLNIEYERCERKQVTKRKTIHLPKSVLKASAGLGNWLDEQQLESVSVIDTAESRKATLIIEVEGDSMNPMFQNGDNVLVNTQQRVEIGDIGIFILDGNGYIKKFAEDRLISLNPDYDDIYPSEFGDCRCVGKVLGKTEIVE